MSNGRKADLKVGLYANVERVPRGVLRRLADPPRPYCVLRGVLPGLNGYPGGPFT